MSFRPLLGTLVLLQATTAFAQIETPDGYAPLDRIRAIVDNDVVTNFELERSFAPLMGLGAGILDPEARQKWIADKRKEVLEEHINTLLVIAEARKLDLEIGPQEIAAHVAALKRQLRMTTDDELELYIQGLGFRNLEDYQDNVEREMLKARTIRLRLAGRVRPSAEEVDRVFDRDFHKGKFMDEVHAQHILIKLPQLLTPETVQRKSELAHRVRAEALAETEPWCDLVAKYSDDTNKRSCGDLGFFARCTLDPEFERVVFKVKPGEFSPVERTNFGFHIIRVLERRRVPIPEGRTTQRLKRCVRMDLETENRVKAYEAYTSELRVTHHVEVKP